ncbi:MAG: hypothetical protein JST30_05240 [Armatimonadetes bacterium]|nr:hypothetical protein [Armatimonadota bacterium]
MRLVALGLGLVLAVQVFAQKLPADGSCQWSIGPQGETVFTVLEVSWKWTDKGRRTIYRNDDLQCGGFCRGKKHLLHEQCDQSCDTPCTAIHDVSLGPLFPDMEVPEQLDQDVARFTGMSETRNYGYTAMTATYERMGGQAYESDPALQLKAKFGCWNQDPCSYKQKVYDVHDIECVLTYTLKRETRMPDGSVVTTQGPVRTSKISGTVPVPDSVRDGEGKEVVCRCSIVSDDKDKEVGFWGPGDNGTGLVCMHGDDRHRLDGKGLEGLGLTLVGQSMDRFTVTVSNKPPDCDKLIIPAGWEFQCVDGSLQDTVLVEDATIEFMTGSNVGSLTLNVEANPWNVFDRAVKDVRTLCLNIKKREPEPGKQYRLVPPSRPAVVDLARMTRDSRFKGPWDQTRLWIVTDRASLDDVGKVLLPGPTPRMYLRELYTVVERNLFRIDPKTDLKLADNRLFVTSAPDEGPLDWFVAWKVRNDKAKSLAWLKGNTKALVALFEKEKVEEAAEGVAMLAAALTKTRDKDATMTAVEILLDPHLEPYRKPVANDPHSSSVTALLTWTTDAVLAGKVLDYIEACRPPSAPFACRNVSKDLPQDVQDRAKRWTTALRQAEGLVRNSGNRATDRPFGRI